MKSALIRLRESRDSMSATERSVSDYLLSHQREAMGLSIHQLAERTFASPSTVIRMCQRIGFAGYKEFRQAVTCEVAVQRFNEDQERQEITRTDSLDDIVDKITYKNILSLEDTKSLIDTDSLRACVELLRSARAVLLFAVGSSLCPARDLYLKLLRLDKPCVINDDLRAQLLQAANSHKDDVAIVVSCSGETREIVQCMRALRDNGTPTVAITRQEATPVAELADYRLYTTDSAAIRSGGESSRVSQLNIIDILYAAYANSEYEHSLDQISKTRMLKPVASGELELA